MRLRPILAVVLVGLGLACGGGGGSVSWNAAPSGKVTVRLGSDSFPGYDQAVVSVEKLEASTDGANWVAMGNVQATYDLMALQNGHSQVMLSSASLPSATYTQFRITWATRNYSDGARPAAYAYPTGSTTGQTLSMPATTSFAGPVTISSSGSTVVRLMLSGQQAIQVRATTTPFAFQATGRAYDIAQTATLTGHLLDGSTPLAGAEVYAETVDGLGVATIQRRAFTDANGQYFLEALPTSALYFVVSQPGNTTAYGAKASDPVSALSPTTYTADLSFSGAQTSGALTLTITQASLPSEGTWGELRQNIPTGVSGTQFLIIRSQTAATGVSQDQVGFTGVAPGIGIYGVTAERSTSGGTPVTKAAGSLVTVSSGATTQVSISYP